MKTPLLAAVDHRLPMTAQVYEALRHAIITMQLRPMEKLSEKELAQRLGVSRTPVREALTKLADDGLVNVFPQHGTFISPIRFAAVVEAQFIREALEIAVIQKAVIGGDPEVLGRLPGLIAVQKEAGKRGDLTRFLDSDEAFHRTFCESVGQQKSWRIIQAVKLQMDRVRYLSLPEPGSFAYIIRQHESIIRAVEKRDPERAQRALRVHVREVLSFVEALFTKRPDLFEPAPEAGSPHLAPASFKSARRSRR